MGKYKKQKHLPAHNVTHTAHAAEKPKTKTLGLALGGGGARGLAHIGILQVLEENNIPVSLIAATSMGAIVGGSYCAGTPLRKIEAVVRKLSKDSVGSLSNFNLFGESILKPKKAEHYIKDLVDDTLIENCKIPFIGVATDLSSGKEFDIRAGSLSNVMMASSAYPPLFPPVFTNDHYLMDGGILNLVPVNIIRSMVDIAIGVNMKSYTSQQFIAAMIYDRYYKKEKGGLFGHKHWFFKQWKLNVVLMANIVMRTLDISRQDVIDHKIEEGHPDLMLEPDVEDFSFFGFKDYERIIQAGRVCAKQALPKIKNLIAL